MLKQTGLCVWVGALAAAACGGPSGNDFSGTVDAGGQAQSGGSSGSSGSQATGGTSAAAGRGGSSTGGSGGSSTGGSGGSAKGGTANGGSAGAPLGGSSGDATTGGTGMTTGGSGNETGGSGSGMGGTGMATGGTGNETGGSGGGLGGAGMTGMAGRAGKGGSAGAGPNCDELATAYAHALSDAKVCNANSGKDQCTKLVKSSLSCGCDQFANPDNMEALTELTRLKKEAAGCTEICPAIACLPAGEGTCESDGPNEDAGHCASLGAILQ